MGVEFVDRLSNWRGRGRPRAEPDAELVDLLRGVARRPDVMGRLTLDQGETVEEVRRTITQLRAAARHLGLALHLQPRRAAQIHAAGVVAFYVTEEGTQ